MLVADWLKIAIERFQESIKQKKIGVTNKLFDSFLSNIISNSGGNVSKLEIQFLFYGRYVDIGVGKGMPVGGRRNIDFSKYRTADGRLKSQPRKAKKWYSKTKAYEVGKLTSILAENYGLQTAKAVESTLSNQNILIEI